MKDWQIPQSGEIARKLRHDFAHNLEEKQGERADQTDPILSLIFQSFAAQVAGVYEQAKEAIPLAVLDELMEGVGMPARRARAAQTVMKFTLQDGMQVFEAGTPLIAEGQLREKLTFTLDTAIVATTARIAFAAVYQDGGLRLHQGTETAKVFADVRPAYDAFPAELGVSPALFLAIDVDEKTHLSHHGIYFELNNDAKDLQAHLGREVWCLLDGEGGIRAEGLLRPRPANAGVRRLHWLARETRSFEDAAEYRATKEAAVLPDGVYGNRVFVLPEIPPEPRLLTTTPARLDAPLRRIFQAMEKPKLDELLKKERAWLRIGLPGHLKGIAEDLHSVSLHCTTASNVEVENRTVRFATDGLSVPIANGGTLARQMVNAIAVIGERGGNYLHVTEPSPDRLAGRFRFRQSRIEFTPARTERGEPESYVNLRLQLTNGELGNKVARDKITILQHRTTSRTLKIENLNAALGGADGEEFQEAKQRFTDLLLSRERPVTYPDLEAMAKAFSPRILSIRARPALERRADGLHRVQRITIGLDRESFALPDEEAKFLREELQEELQRRTLLGLEVTVESEWTDKRNSSR
jgi:hypothetical protein